VKFNAITGPQTDVILKNIFSPLKLLLNSWTTHAEETPD